MWHIYNKTYDLTTFIKNHPGGEDILLKTKGEKDITALFETYHAFSDKDKIKQILNKYEITNAQTTLPYITNINNDKYKYDFTNYNQLVNEVKKVFPTHSSIKSTFFFTIFNSFTFALYVYSFYCAMISNQYSTFCKCLAAFIAGTSYVSLGFNVMHNASHYAVTLYPKVDVFLAKLWNSWGLWNANLWFYHHVYNHHSFTSQDKQDPDLYHLRPFARKTRTDVKIPSWLLKIQDKLTPVLLFLFPGQYMGQAISYVIASYKSRIFSIKIPDIIYYDNLDAILISSNIYCLYCGLYSRFYLSTFIYIITLNFWYTINIIPDHDTYESSVENHYSGDDWCKMQICNSANFSNQSITWTYLFGGINYQIEHHLFPNVSHVHYPAISKIVKEYCKTQNIPYVHHHSPWDAYKSFIKKLNYMK